MKEESHLYPGYKFASALPSVSAQRRLQGELLSSLNVSRVLMVGSAYGEEANVLIRYFQGTTRPLDLTLIDLVDVSCQLHNQPNLRCLSSQFCFYQTGLLNACEIENFGKFDLVQCGFLLHDFHPTKKDVAFSALMLSVRPGGYVLVSDIFLSLAGDCIEADTIYQGFLSEAKLSMQAGNLDPESFSALVGDGATVGLERSKRKALSGERDFFETRDSMLARALRIGLEPVKIANNPLNSYMSVILFQRPSLNNILKKNGGGE